MKLFSILTVCLNAEKEIKGTIQSVFEQDFDDYEYLIQDGASSDQTVKIVESFAPAFAEKGITFRVISEKDRGIYDAMNRVAKKAQGKWLLYMNAGDYFVDGTVLNSVSRNEALETADIVYGDEILRNNDRYMYKKARPIETIRFGMPFRHQSTFNRKELFADTSYSLKYRIGSDYLFYLQMYLKGKKFVYIPMAISIYEVNGISSDTKALLQERLEIYEDMPKRDEEAIQKVQEWLENEERVQKRKKFMYEHLWKFTPKILRQIRRRFLKEKTGWKTEKEFFTELNKSEKNV